MIIEDYYGVARSVIDNSDRFK